MPEMEVIVSDDSTTNAVKSIVAELNDSRIKYYHHDPSLGSPSNWNYAIGMAKGDLIKIMHHDDYFSDRDCLTKFSSAFERNPSLELVYCWSKIVYRSTGAEFIHKIEDGHVKRIKRQPEFLFFRNMIGAPSAVMFRKKEELSFDPRYKWLVDVEFYIRFLKEYKKSECINETLVTIVSGEEGQITREVSKDKQRVIAENLTLFAEIFNSELDNKKSMLFFQELFDEYDIHDMKQLASEFEVPSLIHNFMAETFLDKPKHQLLKRIKKRLLTSRYNKRIFKIERF